MRQDETVGIQDSYTEFLDHFQIDRQDFFKWGLDATIFPPVARVAERWEALKVRIFTNQTVYIRGYVRDRKGTQRYQDLYQTLLHQTNVTRDPTNNAEPRKLLHDLTGKALNRDLYNYQVSHIWGRTKNLFLFEAPWNLCYTPKIIDPFTGHETQGPWPVLYQERFLAKAYDLYQPYIDEYNKLCMDLDLERRAQDYIQTMQDISERERIRFSKDVARELSPVTCISR